MVEKKSNEKIVEIMPIERKSSVFTQFFFVQERQKSVLARGRIFTFLLLILYFSLISH